MKTEKMKNKKSNLKKYRIAFFILLVVTLVSFSLASAYSSINCTVTVPELDTAPPTLIVTQPLNNQDFSTNEITAVGTVCDNVDLPQAVSVTVNDDSVSVGTDGSFTHPSILTEGSNAITIVATDSSANSDTVTRTVTYTPPPAPDITSPTLIVTQPLNNQDFATNEITVVGTVSDNVDQPHAISVTVNGVSVDVDPDGSFTHPLILLNEGSNTIAIVATDTSDYSVTLIRTVTYTPVVEDILPPTLIADQPLNNQDFATNGITFVGTVSDNVNQPHAISVTVNGDSLSVEPDGSFTYPLILTEGPNTIIIVAKDTSGNTATVTRTVIYTPPPVPDTTPPILVVTHPLDGEVFEINEITISGTATDESGIFSVTVNGDAIAVAPDGSFSTHFILTEGSNTITIVATDNSEYRNTATVTRTVTYTPPPVPDSTPPNLVVTHPLDGQVFEIDEITVNGFATDESGIFIVTVNGGSATLMPDDSFSFTLTLNPGENTITVVAMDNSEKHNTATVTRTVTYTPPVVLDTTPPTLVVNEPMTDQHFETNLITISGTATDESGISSVTINGDAIAVASDGFFSTLFILTEGSNTIIIVAIDNSENRNTESVTRTVTYTPPVVSDTTAPTLIVNQPRDRQVFKIDEIVVSGTTTDKSGISSVTVNGDAIPVEPDGFFSTHFILTEGSNIITIVAIDNSENRNTATVTRTVTYTPPPVPDTTPPTLIVPHPLDGQIFDVNKTTVMGTATDDSGIRSVTVNGAEVALVGDKFSCDVDLKEGQNTITVTAIDFTDNLNTQTIEIIVTYTPPVDLEEPTLILSQPDEGLNIVSMSNVVVVSGTVYDDSGIKSLTVNGNHVAVTDTLFSVSITLVEGQNVITVVATDNSPAQNQRTVTRNVTYSIPVVGPGPPYNISLSANPPSLNADGEDAADITAHVTDENETDVADGTSIYFSTTNGTLYPSRAELNGSGSSTLSALTSNGAATVVLVSSILPGTATVTATSGTANNSIDVPFKATASTSSEFSDISMSITHSPSAVAHNCSVTVSGGIMKIFTSTSTAVGIVDGTGIAISVGTGSTLDFTVVNPIIMGGRVVCEIDELLLNNSVVKSKFTLVDIAGSEVDVELVTTCMLSGKEFMLTQHANINDAIKVRGGADAGLVSADVVLSNLLDTVKEEFGNAECNIGFVTTSTLEGSTDQEIVKVPIKITVGEEWFKKKANKNADNVRLIETNLTNGLVEEILPVLYWIYLPNQTITFWFEAENFSTFAIIAQPAAASDGRTVTVGGPSGPAGGIGAHAPPDTLTIPIANPGINIFNFEWLGLDIISISMDLKHTVFNLKTTLGKAEKTAEVPTPSGNVYAYFEISSNVHPDNLKKGEVKFRVNEEWIRKNSINAEKIKLKRYVSGSGWEALPTKKIGEDDRNVYFSAETKGFSLFAITGEKKGVEFAPPKSTPTTPTASPTPTPATAPVPVIGWFIIIVAIAASATILSVVYLVLRRI